MQENNVKAVIEGFYFDKEQDIEQAKREVEGISYIKSNTNMEDPETVRQLYQKLTEEHLFQTPIGMAFLKELWDYLAGIPGMEEQQLLPINLPKEVNELKEKQHRPVSDRESGKIRKTQQLLEQSRRNFKISLLANLFLLILVVGMIIISATGDNSNIVNYENKIINKYADWEQELQQRENEIKRKEQEMGITP